LHAKPAASAPASKLCVIQNVHVSVHKHSHIGSTSQLVVAAAAAWLLGGDSIRWRRLDSLMMTTHQDHNNHNNNDSDKDQAQAKT
jgi:hypothetical protein